MKRALTIALLFPLMMTMCHIENLEITEPDRKIDFTHNSYVLATEDASDVDITMFFSFNMEEMEVREAGYDLIKEHKLFTNSNPSVSSGHHSMGSHFFAMAKDKKGMSSTPGLYQLSLSKENRVFLDKELSIPKTGMFPSKKFCIVNKHLGFLYNESKGGQKLLSFNPTLMIITGEIDLHDAVARFRPDSKWIDGSGNNLVRTGSLVLDHKEGKLYVSVVFLEKAGFNLIANDEKAFYLAVVDIKSRQVEKIIEYEGIKTVGFFVSENNPTTMDETGHLYFSSWGWNQFNQHVPSRVIRIRRGESEFDKEWHIDIEKLAGKECIVQSMIAYNKKLYLHVSDRSYTFVKSAGTEETTRLTMSYYEFDPEALEQYRKLDIPSSDASSRVNIFSVVENKLYIAVPNAREGLFNGLYSIDRNGSLEQVMRINNKYRPTRLYKLTDK